jgi:hypothetical protein
MHSERGQASVEWVGLLLLLALGLAALARFAPRADAGALGPELIHAIGCATRGGCDAAAGGGSRTLVTVPPLVPLAPRDRRAPLRRPRALPAPLVDGRRLARRTWHRAGRLYRRSWMFCLGYERVRYDLLHPEVGALHQEIPLSEGVRMANDCVSPVDLVRDYDLLRGGP